MTTNVAPESPLKESVEHDAEHGRKFPRRPGLHPDAPSHVIEAHQETDAHMGVKKVEAAARVYGKYTKWILFISIGFASYIYSLDGSTTSFYLEFAASAFNGLALISSIKVAQSIIVAVGKPVIAKVADVTSRATAYITVLLFYVVGYIVIASAQNIGTIAGGIIIYAVGYTGLQLLTQVVIADITTLKWRGLVSSITTVPFIINAFIGANIAAAIIQRSGFRVGYAMFAILVPATLLPLIVTLFWAERKAKRLGIVDELAYASPQDRVDSGDNAGKSKMQYYIAQAKHGAKQMDLLGLILLGGAVALILLPLTLSQTNSRGWKDSGIIAMLVIGVVTLAIFAVWDLRYASRPVIAPRFVKNRTVVLASMIGFFDFMSFYLTFTYLFVFVLVVKPWSLLDATYFMQTQTVALTVFGFVAGASMVFLRRYKWVLIAGLMIRLLGVGLMIHSRGANASTVELVWTQILQGIGGGFASVTAQVAAQASVPHVDVAMVTAGVLLVTEIGGAIGGAIAGAIWVNTMPDNLARFVTGATQEQLDELFGNISAVLAFPRGDPVREGVILAYDETMKVMVITATVLSIPPVIFACFMPNWYLGDRQNAVDGVDLQGELAPEGGDGEGNGVGVRDQRRT